MRPIRSPLAIPALMVLASAALAPLTGASANTEKVLYSFRDGDDGAVPAGPLIRDKDGNLYGTTIQGGTAGGPYDLGTVFELMPDGSELVLHTFAGGADGSYPFGLVRNANGNLYGATTVGGGDCNCGTIYRLRPSGKKTTLHVFTGGKDGASPSGLAIDAHGDLYGFASSGGAHAHGVVFTISRHGKERVLYAFTGADDGARPTGNPVFDASGNLYGNASAGGASGHGVVFRLTPDGTQSVLHAFAGGSDGSEPSGPPVLDAKGNLLGTTAQGGSHNKGTVFEIAADGHETVLYAFAGDTDGGTPESGVILDTSGNLYGGAYYGAYAQGAVFKVTPVGHERVLYSFTGGRDGFDPSYGGLVMDKRGNLYGTGMGGGTTGSGVVFKILKK